MSIKKLSFASIFITVMAFGVALMPLTVANAGTMCGEYELKDGQTCCGGVPTSFDFNCADDVEATSGNLEQNPIFSLLLFTINFLTAGIGIAAVAFIVWGGITYSTAGGNREKVQSAISYITNAVIGLLLFMAMFAIANFLIPGGVFN